MTRLHAPPRSCARFVALVLCVSCQSFAQLPEIARTASPSEAFAQLGSDVTTEGDFDGDGVRDLAAAFRVEIPGVRVWSGLTGALIRTFVAADVNATFSRVAVTALGDLNGDGMDELVLGLPNAGGSSGEVRVLSGGTGAELYRITGTALSALGSSLDRMGDVDGDGLDDFVVGAPSPLSSTPGRVEVRSGSNGALIHAAISSGPLGDGLGTTVWRAGDLDGDGTQDVLAFAPFDLGGRLTALSGTTGAPLHSFVGSGSMPVTILASSLGDADGDGLDDYLTGYAGMGSAQVRSGLTGIALGAVSFSFPEVVAQVAGLGDVDGDGLPDLAVAVRDLSSTATTLRVFDSSITSQLASVPMPSANLIVASGESDVDGDAVRDVVVGVLANTGLFDPGSVTAYSGVGFGVLQQFFGQSPPDRFGEALAAVGDLDGDGAEDWIVGAPNEGGIGVVRILSGRDDTPIHVLIGATPGARFGAAVSGAGDVNADGVPDFIVGAPEAGPTPGAPLSANGTATVFSGVDGSVLHQLVGSQPLARTGGALSGVGDANGDGFDDLAVRSASDITVISGFDGAPIVVVSALNPAYGPAFTGGVDIDGDLLADIAIGAPSGAGHMGQVTILSGASGATIQTLTGSAPQDRLGHALAFVGDLDGDGVEDLVAVSKEALDAGVQPPVGTVKAFSSATGATLFEVRGITGEPVPQAVSRLGDVDDDGVPDFAVGDIESSNSFVQRPGRVRVLSGVDGSRLATFDGDGRDHELGFALAGGIDFNGDGVPDVLAGAPAAGSELRGGAVLRLTAAGALPYGLALGGTQTLVASWQPVTGTVGVVRIDQAASGAAGGALLGLASAQQTVLGVELLVDPSPTLALASGFGYDGAGSFAFGLDLHQPALAGVSLYVQAFEVAPAAPNGLFASNGLQLLFIR